MGCRHSIASSADIPGTRASPGHREVVPSATRGAGIGSQRIGAMGGHLSLLQTKGGQDEGQVLQGQS